MTETPTAAPSGPTHTAEGHVLGAPAQLTPEQATAELAARKAAYDARNAPVVSSPAAQRLNQIYNTPELREALLLGRPALVAERDRLHAELIAAGESTAPTAPVFETTNSIDDPSALTRREREGLIDGMRDRGLSPLLETFLGRLDRGEAPPPTQGDRIAATRALDRLSKNPAWQARIAAGDPQAREDQMALRALKSWAVDDGQPVSPGTLKWLAERGLG
jgi:hypothetical protein